MGWTHVLELPIGGHRRGTPELLPDILPLPFSGICSQIGYVLMVLHLSQVTEMKEHGNKNVGMCNKKILVCGGVIESPKGPQTKKPS